MAHQAQDAHVHQLDSKALALRELLGLPNDYFGSPASFEPGWRSSSSPTKAASLKSTADSPGPSARASQQLPTANAASPFSSPASTAAQASVASAAAPKAEHTTVHSSAIEAAHAAKGFYTQHPAVNVTSPVLPHFVTSAESTPQRRWSGGNTSFSGQIGTMELPRTGSRDSVGGAPSASEIAQAQAQFAQLPLDVQLYLLAAELGITPEVLAAELGLYGEVNAAQAGPPAQPTAPPPQALQLTGSAPPFQPITHQAPSATAPPISHVPNAPSAPTFPAEYMLASTQAGPAGLPALIPVPEGAVNQILRLPGGKYLVSASMPLLTEEEQQGQPSNSQLYLTATAVFPDLQSAVEAGAAHGLIPTSAAGDLQPHTFDMVTSAPSTIPTAPLPTADSLSRRSSQKSIALTQSVTGLPRTASGTLSGIGHPLQTAPSVSSGTTISSTQLVPVAPPAPINVPAQAILATSPDQAILYILVPHGALPVSAEITPSTDGAFQGNANFVSGMSPSLLGAAHIAPPAQAPVGYIILDQPPILASAPAPSIAFSAPQAPAAPAKAPGSLSSVPQSPGFTSPVPQAAPALPQSFAFPAPQAIPAPQAAPALPQGFVFPAPQAAPALPQGFAFPAPQAAPALPQSFVFPALHAAPALPQSFAFPAPQAAPAPAPGLAFPAPQAAPAPAPAPAFSAPYTATAAATAPTQAPGIAFSAPQSAAASAPTPGIAYSAAPPAGGAPAPAAPLPPYPGVFFPIPQPPTVGTAGSSANPSPNANPGLFSMNCPQGTTPYPSMGTPYPAPANQQPHPTPTVTPWNPYQA